MRSKDRLIAESVLKRLCLRAQIDGIRFGSILQMLITNQNPYEGIYGQVFLNLNTRWTVFDSYPSKLPNSEDELPEISQEDEIQAICRIRERVITNIELMADYPHLVITLDDGKIIFVNGQNDPYEAWDLGVALSDRPGTWWVFALPGGAIEVWAPDDFISTWPPNSSANH